jgi:hypothetical protein
MDLKGVDMTIEANIKKFLETPFWPASIEPGLSQFRTHDDCDGKTQEGIRVTVGVDGDMWISAHMTHRWESCRFRTHEGGGLSLRTRNALLILAMAIQLDNQEFPIRKDMGA